MLWSFSKCHWRGYRARTMVVTATLVPSTLKLPVLIVAAAKKSSSTIYCISYMQCCGRNDRVGGMPTTALGLSGTRETQSLVLSSAGTRHRGRNRWSRGLGSAQYDEIVAISRTWSVSQTLQRSQVRDCVLSLIMDTRMAKWRTISLTFII